MIRLARYLLLLFFFLQACAFSPANIPESLEPQIDKNLAFRDVLQTPHAHKGKVIMIGGEVLHAQRLQAGTEIEMLQLPLDEWQGPTRQRTDSEGRLFASTKEFLDPATLPIHTRLTIVAEVTGQKTAPLDESEYKYPTFTIRHLHVWDDNPPASRKRSRPRWSIFGGGGTGGRVGGGVGVGIGF